MAQVSLDRMDPDAEVLAEAKGMLRKRMGERGQDGARVEYLLFLISRDPVIRNSLQMVCELEPNG